MKVIVGLRGDSIVLVVDGLPTAVELSGDEALMLAAELVSLAPAAQPTRQFAEILKEVQDA